MSKATINIREFAKRSGVHYETARSWARDGKLGPVLPPVAGCRGRRLVVAELKKRGLWPEEAAVNKRPGQIVLPLDPERKLRILRGAVAHAAPEAQLDAAIAAFYVLAALLGPQEGESPLPDVEPLLALGDEIKRLEQQMEQFDPCIPGYPPPGEPDDPDRADTKRILSALHRQRSDLIEQLANLLPRDRSGT